MKTLASSPIARVVDIDIPFNYLTSRPSGSNEIQEAVECIFILELNPKTSSIRLVEKFLSVDVAVFVSEHPLSLSRYLNTHIILQPA